MDRHFTPHLFDFLRRLAENNDRDWFKAHQAQYEEQVRGPALAFIEDLSEPLLGVSAHFSADPRKVGGSLFRIQRDTRFSKDKTPYKTHVGIHLRHVATRDDVHAPGFYLHLERRNCFAALGLWRPATAHAGAIRARIAADPEGWRHAAYRPEFVGMYGALEGESLRRPPAGFDADHPFVGDLMRKDFIAGARLRQSDVTASGFIDAYLGTIRTGMPLMRFLCGAVGLAC